MCWFNSCNSDSVTSDNDVTFSSVDCLNFIDAYITPHTDENGRYESTKEELKNTFKEFSNYECSFKDCMHIKEKGCKVLEAVSKCKILPSRYINYTRFLKECHENNSKLYK